jgi:hypothetical protein
LIRDGRRTTLRHGRWDNLEHMLLAQTKYYRRELWAEAPYQAQVWIEKAGLADALHEKARALGVHVYPASGFTGAGYLRAAIKETASDPRPLVIFELVDYDSSGARMAETVERRVTRFARQLGVELEAIVRVALRRDQIDAHQIPLRPQKESTHRRDTDDPEAAELDAVDALYPGLLDAWLEDSINQYWPADARAGALAQEQQDRDRLAGLAASLEADEKG